MERKNACLVDYGTEFPDALTALPYFQMPTKKEIDLINSWYPSYIFYKTVKGGRKIAASCCERRKVIDPARSRTQTPALWALMRARHNETVVCPFCGRTGTVKCVGRTRDSFREPDYTPVVFLREDNGGLMALAVWAMKRYLPGAEHLGPAFHIVGAYRFRPGQVDLTEYYWGSREAHLAIQGDYRPSKQRVKEPFRDGYGCMFSYPSYRVIGLDAIKKSDFRYCGYERFKGDNMPGHSYLMGFLAACCFWPRDVEMLLKSGGYELVRGLVVRGVKNADVYRWGETSAKKAFGLDGQEMRAFAAEKYDLHVLKIYKRLRRDGYQHSFALARTIWEMVPGGMKDVWEFMRRCQTVGQEPARVIRYLSKDPPCARHAIPRWDRYRLWKDYINFCTELGYDLTDETVALPKGFMRKHDEAAAAVTEKHRIEREKQDAEKERAFAEILKNRSLKYDFSMNGLLIRVARSREEVVNEGNALKHCVGGYAIRHVEGKTTILVLRDTERPDQPLVTVEMDGNRLVQAHGYANDRGTQSPLVTYKAFFDTWLDWLKRGSPRDEDGTPKMRKKKGSNAA